MHATECHEESILVTFSGARDPLYAVQGVRDADNSTFSTNSPTIFFFFRLFLVCRVVASPPSTLSADPLAVDCLQLLGILTFLREATTQGLRRVRMPL